MKRIRKFVFILVFALLFLLTGCDQLPISEKTYDFVYEHEGVAVKENEFDIDCFKLNITLNGVTSTVDVTNDMIITGDISLLGEGTHIVGLTYKEYSEFITVTIEKNVTNPDDNPSGTDNPGPSEDDKPVDFDMSYYASANGLSGNDLKLALRAIISVVKYTEKYADLRQDLQKTDASLTNSGKIVDFYSHKEMNATWDSGVTWNREHVWPRSKAWYQYEGAGADIHCLRPADSHDNSSRGNTPFGIGRGYFEPDDCSKGDVARIIFYMLVRYKETDSSYPITNVAQSLEMLLDWNAMDPVDELEIQRNNIGYSIQGNRNPFIDYSDYAYYIWDQSRLNN